MTSQRYERVSGNDEEENESSVNNRAPIPASPPPSFHSRASSPASRRLLTEDDPLATEAERTLASTFDSPSDDENSDNEADDRRRLMRGRNVGSDDDDPESTPNPRDNLQRQVTDLPNFAPTNGARVYGGGSGRANDGVFANLSAKPERIGEKVEEQPPSYEAAAADATPPYWETTILAPGMASDEVFIDGLPVGSVFAFVWNGMISMSFQLVGFLLTYLLHTTHAAKNGSRAGLGITLVQYGFYMKSSGPSGTDGGSSNDPQYQNPPDPNSHDFNPGSLSTVDAASAAAAVASMIGQDGQNGKDGQDGQSGWSNIRGSEWLAYILMIVGWFILIRSVSDFLRARRMEQVVLQSPDRGLGTAVVAEGEHSETVV